jgi:hypothetical protein
MCTIDECKGLGCLEIAYSLLLIAAAADESEFFVYSN